MQKVSRILFYLSISLIFIGWIIVSIGINGTFGKYITLMIISGFILLPTSGTLVLFSSLKK